ncbi:Zinc finger protein 26 [Papilio machaon]|uniref:Zinc finger protein 26 n=1 Tax=Papilio machaon TaxID=76193 RepID=A0A0N1IPL4_PAPMA|nr:Zinc finger protein 26 [Papilio machaon]
MVLFKIKEIVKSRQKYEKVKDAVINSMCEECGERFSSHFLLVRHMRLHTKYKYPCKKCPKVFSSQIQLEEHAERIHYPKKIQCTKCTKMFSTEKMLKIHDSAYHVPAVCKQCYVQYPSKKALRAHMDKHKLNRCSHCNKHFLNKHTYKFHLNACGNGKEKQPSFFCDICNKGYVRKNGLRTHLKTDHDFGKVLNCNWCNKKFDAVSRLKNHIVKHTRERNFSCEQCGGKFVTHAALIYHIRLHTGERPFPCDMCDESFLSASRRMEHKRRKHIGPTEECPVCHVKFITSHQLRKHVQRHSNPHSKLYVADTKQQYSVLSN